MTEKEKLIELLGDFSTPVMLMDVKLIDWTIPTEHLRDSLADYLIANGVRLETNQVTSDENKRWIPVSERLPKEEDANPNESVLAIEKHDGFARSWIWDCVARYPQEFTHWMPLPEPPREERQ